MNATHLRRPYRTDRTPNADLDARQYVCWRMKELLLLVVTRGRSKVDRLGAVDYVRESRSMISVVIITKNISPVRSARGR